MTHNGTDNDVTILRYYSDGSLDTAFANNGVQTLVNTGRDRANDVIINKTNGRYLVVGHLRNDTQGDGMVLRYWPSDWGGKQSLIRQQNKGK